MTYDLRDLLDPANDPREDHRLDPDTDFGWDGSAWHRLVSAYGTEASTLCGFRIPGSPRTTRTEPILVCSLCEDEHTGKEPDHA